jgi:hypothetical protein
MRPEPAANHRRARVLRPASRAPRAACVLGPPRPPLVHARSRVYTESLSASPLRSASRTAGQSSSKAWAARSRTLMRNVFSPLLGIPELAGL